VVEIEHEGVGAFNEYPVVVLVFLKEGKLVNNVRLENFPVFL
jgi:hypothetical protein